MNIDYSKLRGLKARSIARALERDGFTLKRQRGSHRRYSHDDGRRVMLSFHHASDTFPLPALRSILEVQAGWTQEDLARLGIVSSS